MKFKLSTLINICCLLLLYNTSVTFSQTCTNDRYLNDNLFSTTRTDDIYYGTGPTYPVNAQQDLYFDLYEPVGDTLTKRPLIVMAFGGSFLGGSKRQGELVSFCEAMTRRGYVVASIDYRVGFNFFSTSSATEAVYRAVQDMKGAIRFLKANAATYKVDTNLIYAGGNSAGGITALHAAYVEEDERASSALLAPTYSPDMGCGECGANTLNSPPDNLYGIPTKGVISLWGAIGDSIWLEPGDVPVISFHSQGDNTVNYGYDHPYGFPIFPKLYGSSTVHQRATNVGVYSELYPYPGSTHEIWNNAADALFIENTTADFMYDCMKPITPVIAGNNLTCPNSIETYTVPFTNGSLYCWTITGGTVVSASSTGNTIDIQWGTTGGTLIVREINCNVIESDLSTVFTVNITTLTAPTTLTSNNATTTTVDLTWGAVTGASSYDLQYRPVGSSTWTSVTALSTTTTTISGLTACTNYEFQVEAVCNGSGSGYSVVQAFSTSAGTPTSLTTANVTTNSADLSWGNSGGVYDLQYRPIGSSTWISVTALSATTTTINGLTACTNYEFQVEAICNGSGSGYSTTQTFSTSAGTPTSLTTANVTTNSADLSWGNSGGVYDLQYRPVGSSTWTSITALSATTTTINGLTACTNYEFQVEAVCNGSGSGYSAIQTFSTSVSTPTSLTTANVTGNSADLSWGNGGSVYDLQYRPVGSNIWTSVTALSTTTTTINGLIACTDYEFQVEAICNGLGSGYSTIETFTTDCARVQMKVFLAGAYNSFTNNMSTNLSANTTLPLTQPYNTAPWNYMGTESVGSIPSNVTDWVLIELRDATNNNTVIAQRAALLLNNGDVQDIDGISGVQFAGLTTANYYIVVRHRNHLDVMTANTVNLPSTITYDFTTSANQAVAGQQENVGSAFALYAGDVNGDGIISVYDYNFYIDQTANTGYIESDCTLDSNNTVGDFNAYRPNADRIGIRQIRY